MRLSADGKSVTLLTICYSPDNLPNRFSSSDQRLLRRADDGAASSVIRRRRRSVDEMFDVRQGSTRHC